MTVSPFSAEDGSLIVDTNVLMEIIDKHEFVEDVVSKVSKLFVPIEVLMELDNLKTKSGRAGMKARSAIRLIVWLKDKNLVSSPSGSADEIEALLERASKREKGFADKAIITLAKRIGNATILTNDISMRTIAESASIRTKGYMQTGRVTGLSKTFNEFIYLDEKRIEEDSPILPSQFREIADTLDFPYIREHLLGNVKDLDVLSGDFISLGYVKGDPETRLGRFKEMSGNMKIMPVQNINFNSGHFGKVSPKFTDFRQKALFDSLENDALTMVTGPAGSGKTFISLAYMFNKLEKGDFDRIVVFVNAEDARNGAKLGFYKGDLLEKLMQKSIGGILESKVGDKETVLSMIEKETIILKSITDIRGYEVPENSILFITEAQNLDVELMKLAVQRAGNGVKVVIDGDPETQLDSYVYEGHNNGMLRLLEVFRGSGLFGHVHLEKVYRSKIANLAELMTK